MRVEENVKLIVGKPDKIRKDLARLDAQRRRLIASIRK